ncbi:hypothetical protein KR51_00029590 [Rubidibacter lacunae KORDI 51-2]|uniref:Uncharacterized protein n=1 Tax=Rubidibacter lacunae KORDI 51-2 TaxID=582515 RepID=U5DIK1_9CHRO|nr:hypothetical protein KR51_00029590 [Rubidibacter lacunae KORDI 51-2]
MQKLAGLDMNERGCVVNGLRHSSDKIAAVF